MGQLFVFMVPQLVRRSVRNAMLSNAPRVVEWWMVFKVDFSALPYAVYMYWKAINMSTWKRMRDGLRNTLVVTFHDGICMDGYAESIFLMQDILGARGGGCALWIEDDKLWIFECLLRPSAFDDYFMGFNFVFEHFNLNKNVNGILLSSVKDQCFGGY